MISEEEEEEVEKIARWLLLSFIISDRATYEDGALFSGLAASCFIHFMFRLLVAEKFERPPSRHRGLL